MFAPNHQQVFRRLSANTENVIRSTNSNGGDVTKPNSNSNGNSNVGIMNGAMSKTPAATSSKVRRALGDISNRKGHNSSNNNGGGGTISLKKAPTPGGLRLFSQQQQTQQQQRSTKTPGLQSSKRSEVSFMPRLSSGTTLQGKPQNAPLMTIFPDAKNNKSKAAVAPKSILKNRHEDVVDDIELPAGRLWIEQQDDLDDSISLGSLSLPGAATLLEDYHAAARKRHAARLKMNLEEDEQELLAFEEYQAKLLEEEGTS